MNKLVIEVVLGLYIYTNGDIHIKIEREREKERMNE